MTARKRYLKKASNYPVYLAPHSHNTAVLVSKDNILKQLLLNPVFPPSSASRGRNRSRSRRRGELKEGEKGE